MKTGVLSEMPSLLGRPAAFPWRPAAIEIIETHLSWVFLAGELVVKVKKPVTFGFVDYSTPELRRSSCEVEVELNRRLTEGVYLRVIPITTTRDGLEVDGPGRPVEWATLMRRLPAERMLDSMLARGTLPADVSDRLAARLIPFHQSAPMCDAGQLGSAEKSLSIVTDNLTELGPFAGAALPPEQFNLVESAMRRFIDEHIPLFERRAREGYVRDGHGDLRCEHVCLEDGAVQIFDCVEFSPSIRCADIASDLAFLLMDLDRLGQSAIARRIEHRYREEGVDLPPALVNFYRAHRALVRAKVACLTPSSRQHDREPALSNDASDFLNVATRVATTIAPVLIVMTGLSGTGKSTAARQIAAMTGAPVHASDRVRKELAGSESTGPDEWQRGIYGAEWTERTYSRLCELASDDLRSGRPVVLDAAFLTNGQRQTAADLAIACNAPMVLVETWCSREIAEARISRRLRLGSSHSDASLDTYRHQLASSLESPVSIPRDATHVRIDTGGSAVGMIDPVIPALVRAHALTPVIRDHE